MTILGTYFGLPDGAVWGNLIASLIWAAPALAHLHWLQARRHRELTGGRCASCRASTRCAAAAAPMPRPVLTWNNPAMPGARRWQLTGG